MFTKHYITDNQISNAGVMLCVISLMSIRDRLNHPIA
jgi:hypothetical protein